MQIVSVQASRYKILAFFYTLSHIAGLTESRAEDKRQHSLHALSVFGSPLPPLVRLFPLELFFLWIVKKKNNKIKKKLGFSSHHVIYINKVNSKLANNLNGLDLKRHVWSDYCVNWLFTSVVNWEDRRSNWRLLISSCKQDGSLSRRDVRLAGWALVCTMLLGPLWVNSALKNVLLDRVLWGLKSQCVTF